MLVNLGVVVFYPERSLVSLNYSCLQHSAAGLTNLYFITITTILFYHNHNNFILSQSQQFYFIIITTILFYHNHNNFILSQSQQFYFITIILSHSINNNNNNKRLFVN